MTTREVLIEARRILTPDGAWTQDVAALDGEGEPVAECDDTAVCWCVDGALTRASSGPQRRRDLAARERAFVALAAARGYLDAGLIAWNDTPGRTQAEVLALLDRAIEEAEDD